MRKNNGLQVTGCKLQVCFLIAASCASLLLNGCVKREIVNIDSKGKNIICFGDSITWGYGAAPGEDYPAVLAKMLNQPVINAGIDGDTSSEGLKRFDSDVLRRNPLLVIIELGGNDFLRKIPREKTLSNIEKMVDKAQQKGAMVAIFDVSAGPFLKDYHFALEKLARQKGAIFISGILLRIITSSALKSDFIHPNGDGYKLVAGHVYRVIIPYLNRNAVLRKGEG